MRQQAPHYNYFKLNVGIPFLDHMDQEMSSRFCEENRPGRDLFPLVPSVVRVNAAIYMYIA